MKLTVQRLLYVLGCGSWRYQGRRDRDSDKWHMPFNVRFSQRDKYNASEEEVKKNLKKEVFDWELVNSCHDGMYVMINLVKDVKDLN